MLSMQPKIRKPICAAVCKQWQYYFEQKTFQKLVLNCSRVKDFGHIIRGREDVVKHICLQVQLQIFLCFNCGNRELCEKANRNNRLFTDALWTLMKTLSSWGGWSRDDGRQGLTLEISVQAPRNTFWNFDCCIFNCRDLNRNVNPGNSSEVCTRKESRGISRRQLPPELTSYIRDIFRKRLDMAEELCAAENVELDFSRVDDGNGGRVAKLPTVSCVKELTVRPWNLRKFEGRVAEEIAKSFENLETFNLLEMFD
ncbi:hypothetical protein V8C35DRAFT_280298 [Trichoderma chlorosporum]